MKTKLFVGLILLFMLINSIVGAQAASYPNVFFFSDDAYTNLIVSDTAYVGDTYNIRMKWFPEYNNEGYDLRIIDNTGTVRGSSSRTFSNNGNPRQIEISWDTSGYKAGKYKVEVTKKFYSLYRWNEAPTKGILYITLLDKNTTPTPTPVADLSKYLGTWYAQAVVRQNTHEMFELGIYSGTKIVINKDHTMTVSSPSIESGTSNWEVIDDVFFVDGSVSDLYFLDSGLLYFDIGDGYFLVFTHTSTPSSTPAPTPEPTARPVPGISNNYILIPEPAKDLLNAGINVYLDMEFWGITGMPDQNGKPAPRLVSITNDTLYRDAAVEEGNNEDWVSAKYLYETYLGPGAPYEEYAADYLYIDRNSYIPSTPSPAPTENPTMKGDVNGDGTVDGRDLLRLARYMAGNGVSVDMAAADVNGDGNVDGRDVLRLAKQLAGG